MQVGNRVDQPLLTSLNQKQKVEDGSRPQFSSVLSASTKKATAEYLDEILGKIDKTGSDLAKYRSIENLKKYKSLIRDFLQTAVDSGLTMEENTGFNRYGHMTRYQIVKAVDEKLVELTDEVLSKQSKAVKILSSVDEIRGLLIDYIV